MCPLTICSSTNSTVYQLQGKSLGVLKKLFEELMGIFPDEYIHIGADETGFSAICNLESKMTSLCFLHADMRSDSCICKYALDFLRLQLSLRVA